MNCEICFESFEKINSFNQHMSYVHHTNHLEEYTDNCVIVEEFRRDGTKFKEFEYCKICHVKSEYTVCVVNGCTIKRIFRRYNSSTSNGFFGRNFRSKKLISSNNVHGCLNCGCIYHDRSLRRKQNCPVCGKGLLFAQDVEGIHY